MGPYPSSTWEVRLFLNKNFFLMAFQGKGNNFLVLVSVAYTLVAETGKMTIRYSEYLLIVFLLLELTVMSP